MSEPRRTSDGSSDEGVAEAIHDVVIVGSGFSGLGMAISLDRAGRRDWVMLEAADDIGGTWRDNAYPGAACDVPSHLYSYSFELNPEWNHVYAQQAEIQRYIHRCADRHGTWGRTRLGWRLEHAHWEAAQSIWVLEIADRPTIRARHVVFAVGALREPRWPAIPGREDFQGPVLHSALWDSELDLTGKRIGVIGTGASAVQIVPALAGTVAHQTVFQRTPPWIKPRADRPYTDAEKQRFATLPGRMALERLRIYLRMESKYPLFFGKAWRLGWFAEQLLTLNMKATVKDPALRDVCRPRYRMGCKRVLASDDWYPALVRDDVDVVTTPVKRITPSGVELDDGTAVDFDVLVCCTGFQVDQPLGEVRIQGANGVDLRERWTPRPTAHLGTTVPGFPNAFVLFGPNTGLGHNSMIVMIEAQIRYILRALDHLESSGKTWFDVKQSALDSFLAEVDKRHRERVWMSGCNSWYLGPDGSNFTLWPGSTLRFMARLRRFDAESFRFG